MERGYEGDIQEGTSQGGFGVSGERRFLSWSDLLRQSYELYRNNFRAFFQMAFLPALLAYLFRQFDRIWIRPRLIPLLHPIWNPHWYHYFLNARNALTFVEGAVYWLFSAFLFAAVATSVLAYEERDEEDPRPLADAFSRARERIGVIFVFGLLCWTCFMLSRLTAWFAVSQIVRRVHLGTIAADVLYYFPAILICGLLSRLGLVIPHLMESKSVSLFGALRRSIEKSEDWELFFMMFVVKAGIVGYGVYWGANYALRWLWHNSDIQLTAYTWVEGIIYVSIAAMLESPLFIAFSLLYRDSKLKREKAIPAVVG